MTLHQLRIFLAAAQLASLTRVGKQLGIAQPSVSQQIGKLEESVGVPLFERAQNRLTLTEAGQILFRHAQFILSELDEAEARLQSFVAGERSIIRIAGLSSIMSALLPSAIAQLGAPANGLEVDIHEAPPSEVLDMLYARRANVGLIAAESLASASIGFKRIPIIEDPYVFAVPASLDLEHVSDPAQLNARERRLLESCIQFHFGTQHTLRVQQWYQAVLPGHRIIVHCRTYEMALTFVRAGLGVCLLPALTSYLVAGNLEGIKFYTTGHATRHTIALMSEQYTRMEPFRALITALQASAQQVTLPSIRPMPEFLKPGMSPSSAVKR
jgi:DNA-binding transcriptional LysR family regulator